MKNIIQLILFATFGLGFLSPAFALDLGTDITIYDGNSSTSKDWYTAREDNEVEPGMVPSQVWDLEGFFFDQSNSLSLVGGYNFGAGVVGNNLLFESGDIFLAKETKPDYGVAQRASDGYQVVDNTYGYDYVLDLDFSESTYAVIKLDEDSQFETAYYKQNEGSSPWQYVSGGTEVGSGGFTFETLAAGATSFVGDTHYLLDGFDLSFLGHRTEFFAHFTMGCGNDNLMGQGTVVPEPSTFLLFGFGGGLVWLVRKRRTAR